jgi:hypothetical protein
LFSQFWPFCLPWPWLLFCTLSHHPGLLTPACPDPEPACCSVPFGLCSGLLTSACTDPEPACCSVPFGLCSGLLTSACLWPVVCLPPCFCNTLRNCLHLGLLLSFDTHN